MYRVLSCCAYNCVQKQPLNLAKLLSERYRLRNRSCESLKLAQLKMLNGRDPGINAAVLLKYYIQCSNRPFLVKNFRVLLWITQNVTAFFTCTIWLPYYMYMYSMCALGHTCKVWYLLLKYLFDCIPFLSLKVDYIHTT